MGSRWGCSGYRRYIEIETAAGTYELKMTGDSDASNWNGPERAFPAKLVAGENLFVRLLVKYDQETNRLGQGAMGYSDHLPPASGSRGAARDERSEEGGRMRRRNQILRSPTGT